MATCQVRGMRSRPPTIPRVNAAVVAEADRHRIFCVRADIAVEGSAVTPASFDYAGLSVGVLAGGEHRRSAAIRSAIHEALQQGLISLESFASTDVVRGGVALVGGGPGDPELITVRGRRLLAQGRRRRRRPAGATGTPRRAVPARRGDRRGQDPVRAGDGPGSHQRGHDRAGRAGRFVVRLKGWRPVRVRPRL